MQEVNGGFKMEISGWWIVVIIMIWAIDDECKARSFRLISQEISLLRQDLSSKIDELKKNKN